MNKNYLEQLEKFLLDNPKVESAINLLIEKGIQAKQSIIPTFDDEETHGILLDHDIVSLYNEKHYELRLSNVFAHCSYLFFKKKFKTKKIVCFTEVEHFIELLSNFREKSISRLGVLAVTKQIPSYLNIRINLTSNYQFDHVLKIKVKNDYNIWKHDGVKALQDALPYLIIKPQRILEFVIHCLQIGASDYGWYESIKKRYESHPAVAWKLLNLVKKQKEDLNFLIAHLLQCLSLDDFEKAFDELQKNLSIPRFTSSGLNGLSMMNFPSKKWIEKTLELTESTADEFSMDIVRLYSKLYLSKESSDAQKSECIRRLRKLISTGDLNLKGSILFQFSRMEIDEILMIEILKEYYITGNKAELAFFGDINFILVNFVVEENRFKILNHFINKFPKENFIQIFSSLINQTSKEHLSIWITKWFNDDKLLFNLKAGELVRQGYNRVGDPILSKSLLDRYSIWDVEYIVMKILGFVHQHEYLSSLIFSVLLRTPENKSVNTLVESTFLNHILYNYKSPKAFLKEKIKAGSKLEKKLARGILKEFNRSEARLDNLERLKELEGSSTRINEYHKIRFKGFDLEKEVYERSSIAQMARRIQMKAGKGFFFRNKNGSYSSTSNFGFIQHSFEMPRGEFVNPVGQELNRRFYQIFKRRK